jgi:hypothetical protein
MCVVLRTAHLTAAAASPWPILIPVSHPPPHADIKKEFDKKYGPTWHCVVGRNFGSYVTHETKNFIYFYLGQVAVLLFSAWDPRRGGGGDRGSLPHRRTVAPFLNGPAPPSPLPSQSRVRLLL